MWRSQLARQCMALHGCSKIKDFSTFGYKCSYCWIIIVINWWFFWAKIKDEGQSSNSIVVVMSIFVFLKWFKESKSKNHFWVWPFFHWFQVGLKSCVTLFSNQNIFRLISTEFYTFLYKTNFVYHERSYFWKLKQAKILL